MGIARPRAHPPNRRTRPSPQTPRGRRPVRPLLQPKTMNLIRVHLRSSAAILFFVAALHAQSFIHMSDPQFGMYTKDQDFIHDTVNSEFAIATSNLLEP